MIFKKIQLDIQFEIKKIVDLEEGKDIFEKGDWVVEGYATTLSRNANGCRFTEEALQQVADGFEDYTTLLFNHDDNKPIGKIVSAKNDGEGVWIKAVISKTEKDVWEKCQDGTLSKFSIAYDAMTRIVSDEQGPLEEIVSAFVYEASLVPVPGQHKAEAVLTYVYK